MPHRGPMTPLRAALCNQLLTPPEPLRDRLGATARATADSPSDCLSAGAAGAAGAAGSVRPWLTHTGQRRPTLWLQIIKLPLKKN